MWEEILLGSLKGRDHIEDLQGKIILKRMLNDYNEGLDRIQLAQGWNQW
jgi:hypothetical protein